MRHLVSLVALSLAVAGACHGGSSGPGGSGAGGTGGNDGHTCTDCTPTGALTFALPSPSTATLWTTTTMDKVLREAAPPTGTGDSIQVMAAKNEFEPFQLVVHAAADATATLSMTAFTGPGTIAAPEIRRVGYVSIKVPSDASSIMSGQIP